MNKLDLFKELKRALTPMDFRSVLSYYRMEIRGNSILCPFHNDKHFGSCFIRKDQKSAYCYVCEKIISAIDLVVYFEDLSPMNAIIFLWEHILGRKVPDYETDVTELINYQEAKLIGLPYLSGYPKGIVNLVHYMDEVPEKYEKIIRDKDDNGYCPVLEGVSRISLYDLEPIVAAEIIQSKTQETIDSWYAYIRYLHSSNFRTGIGNDLDYIREQELEIRKKITVLKKIRNRMSALLKKAS